MRRGFSPAFFRWLVGRPDGEVEVENEAWVIRVGATLPDVGDRPIGKWTRDELEQAREYWHRRREAVETHKAMPDEVKAAELRYCHFWLQRGTTPADDLSVAKRQRTQDSKNDEVARGHKPRS